MVIAQFWAYANDIYTPEAGKRLFAVIAFGASSGAVFGAWISSQLIRTLGVTPLLLAAATVLAMSLILFNVIDMRGTGREAQKRRARQGRRTDRRRQRIRAGPAQPLPAAHGAGHLPAELGQFRRRVHPLLDRQACRGRRRRRGETLGRRRRSLHRRVLRRLFPDRQHRRHGAAALRGLARGEVSGRAGRALHPAPGGPRQLYRRCHRPVPDDHPLGEDGGELGRLLADEHRSPDAVPADHARGEVQGEAGDRQLRRAQRRRAVRGDGLSGHDLPRTQRLAVRLDQCGAGGGLARALRGDGPGVPAAGSPPRRPAARDHSAPACTGGTAASSSAARAVGEDRRRARAGSPRGTVLRRTRGGVAAGRRHLHPPDADDGAALPPADPDHRDRPDGRSHGEAARPARQPAADPLLDSDHLRRRADAARLPQHRQCVVLQFLAGRCPRTTGIARNLRSVEPVQRDGKRSHSGGRAVQLGRGRRPDRHSGEVDLARQPAGPGAGSGSRDTLRHLADTARRARHRRRRGRNAGSRHARATRGLSRLLRRRGAAACLRRAADAGHCADAVHLQGDRVGLQGRDAHRFRRQQRVHRSADAGRAGQRTDGKALGADARSELDGRRPRPDGLHLSELGKAADAALRPLCCLAHRQSARVGELRRAVRRGYRRVFRQGTGSPALPARPRRRASGSLPALHPDDHRHRQVRLDGLGHGPAGVLVDRRGRDDRILLARRAGPDLPERRSPRGLRSRRRYSARASASRQW